MTRPAAMLLVLLGLLAASLPAFSASVSAEQAYKRARVQASNGNWKEALAILEPVLKEDYYFVDAVYLAGLCALALEKYDEAEKHLVRTTELKKDFFPAWQYLATLYLARKDLEKARATLASLGQVKGGAAESHYGFGVLAWIEQKLDVAETEWREALRVSPSMAKAHHNLGILYREKGDRARALSAFQDAVRLAADHPLYRYSLGVMLIEMDRKADGMQHLDRVRAQTERPDVADLALATQMLYNGHPEQAEKAAARALGKNPELTTALVVRARALEALKRPQEARELYEKALADDPNLGEARKALERIPGPAPAEGTPPAEGGAPAPETSPGSPPAAPAPESSPGTPAPQASPAPPPAPEASPAEGPEAGGGTEGPPEAPSP